MKVICLVKSCEGRKFKSEHALHVHESRMHKNGRNGTERHEIVKVHAAKIVKRATEISYQLSDELKDLNEMLMLFSRLSGAGQTFVRQKLQVTD